MHVGILKYTSVGSSLHANDPFLIYTNYACFQLKTWLDRLDHIFLQKPAKSQTQTEAMKEFLEVQTIVQFCFWHLETPLILKHC